MADPQELSPEDTKAMLDYLSLPGPSLPSTPYKFLSEHLHTLPPSLLIALGQAVPPRQRTSIPAIRIRRFLYASSEPTPPPLTAKAGRRRWPLLWQRLGGSRTVGASEETREEEDWVRESFLPGKENTQHVKKLGGFLRGLAEEREWEEAAGAKRVERRLDEQGQEFESDSDDENDEAGAAAEEVPNGLNGRPGPNGLDMEEEEDQEEVERIFEKRLMELFVDGLDTIDYDEIDFTEPPGGDPIGRRDAEDKWFDDEEPSRTPNGHVQGLTEIQEEQNTPDRSTQNGQGEYDY